MRSITPPATVKHDASIIDVTGLDQPLRFQVEIAVQESTPRSFSSPAADYNYDYEMPKLGKQYGKKLGLTKTETDWLNKFWPPHNVFIALEGCCVATIRLYVRALPVLEEELRQLNTSLVQEVGWCQQETIQRRKKEATYGWNSYEEKYTREQVESIIYSTLFRRCENVVREVYGNKRKLAAEFSGLDTITLGQELERRLGEKMNELLPALTSTISPPDEETEVALNLQNVTRWKQQLDELATKLSPNTKGEFVKAVYQLGVRNERNPAIENIFFEASKLIAKYDREEALRFYVYYVHHDLRSVTINNKQLAKTIQKSLFPQPDQLQRFEELIGEFVKHKNIEQALAQVPTVYAKQRKKIQLDLEAIRDVQHQHAGTVELLNGYLQDEVGAEKEGEEEISLAVAMPEEKESLVSSPTHFSFLTPVQQTLLARFGEQNLAIPQADVELFARQHGALRTQLIDGINELCYERLDDVLIEEDGDHYTIYDQYYQQLTTTC